MKNRMNTFLAELIADANGDGGTTKLVGIVDSVPVGAQRQDLTCPVLKHRFVTQTHDSISDTYHGHLYYPIQDGKYLDLEFWM